MTTEALACFNPHYWKFSVIFLNSSNRAFYLEAFYIHTRVALKDTFEFREV